jgi:DNA-binding NarL/FixJ family response regulator
VLVSDLHLPAKDGLLVLRDLLHEQLHTRVVLLAEHIHEEEVLEALRLGAKGFILKDMSGSLLVRCIRKVHAGDTWVENTSMARALEHLLHRNCGLMEAAGLLTPRELDVLRAAATGLRNKEIADRLHVSEGTVKIHLHNIYKKLPIDSRLALTLYAREKGLA